MSSLGSLVDLVLPVRCVGCRAPGVLLCGRCAPVRPQRVPVGSGVGQLEVMAAARYSAAIRRALIAYKERGRRDLAGPLGRLLAGAVDGALDGRHVRGSRRLSVGRAPPRVLLIGVPSARRAVTERGGDHVLRLARHAARRLGGDSVRAATGVLRLDRSVLDSAGLGIADRARNVDGAMRAAAPVAGAAALLVDDIVTTGATLREAHRALVTAGWVVVGAAVVAATPRRVEARPLALLTSSV